MSNKVFMLFPIKTTWKKKEYLSVHCILFINYNPQKYKLKTKEKVSVAIYIIF